MLRPEAHAGADEVLSDAMMRPLALLAILAAATACDASEPDSSGTPLPELEFQQRSARVPDTRTPRIVLLDDDRVCSIESYRTRVLCGDRSWNAVTEIGRGVGEGPGEFQSPAALVRGPGDQVGVIDFRTLRLTLFDSAGRRTGSFSTPPAFRPVASIVDSTIMGLYEAFSDTIVHAPVGWLSLSRDSVVRRRTYRHPSEASRGTSMGRSAASGARTSDSTLVFWIRDYTLQRYATDGEFLVEFTSPQYEPEMPSDRDIEDYASGLEALFGREAQAAELEEFRSRPKRPLVAGGPMVVDSAGRLWVATTEDHDETSHLDLFRRARYLGTVEVRGRLRWFDLHGSTLAVLTEAAEAAEGGVHPLHVDWYRIRD